MKISFHIILLMLLLPSMLLIQPCFAQGYIHPAYEREVPRLSPYDSVMFCSLPEMNSIPSLKSIDLPYFLDNSKLPYYRPIYQQEGNECGQVSGIAYNFTYEMNRLRDLSATDSANQYPPHFPFNFMNGGFGWHGVSYFHSFEVLKALGCPSVSTYGGMSAGGDSRWMSGYDEYLEAMKNRVREVYQIKVGTEDGLMNLKHWLHNHMDGSAVGGVASFYANSPWNLKIFPEGTPEAGKHVIVTWGGDPTHAMTITGYNDSIRYDYNNDGQFTNHLDINDDGKVDMLDWEIGGLLFADGWGSGINFADSGKCYMMYKTLAEKVYEGGIWNHAVHILDVKDVDKPSLAAKISLTHTNRGMIRIQCGVSSNVSDTLPEYSLGFPVFNFQGGNQYMQGGFELEENKTIEFMLDITPLLGRLESNDIKQFFLVVEESDPDNLGEGQIEYFSIIDYSNDMPIEFYSDNFPVPIINNSTTYASITVSSELEIMNITTDELPVAVVGEPYTFQMEHEGGSPPFLWQFSKQCTEESFQQTFDTLGTYIEPENWAYGNIPYALPFNFEMYNKSYDSIYIHPRGFIMFEDTQYPWPYLYDEPMLIRNTEIIAPFLCRYLTYVPDSGHGIWVNGTADQFHIRWRSEIVSSAITTVVDFSLTLDTENEIIFNYGSEFETNRVTWSCGISEGNDLNYHFPDISNATIINPDDAVKLKTIPLPSGLNLNEEGLLSGIPVNYYQHIDMGFCVEDDDHIRACKSLKFSASNLGIFNYDPNDDPIGSVFPNPFRSELSILFKSGSKGLLNCKVYNSSGQLIHILAENMDLQKANSLSWDGHDMSGRTCPPGIYFVHFQLADKEYMRKIIYTGP